MGRKEHKPPPGPARCLTVQMAVLTPTALVLFVGLIAAALLLAPPASSQTSAKDMPENASTRSYGDGWECNIGYRENGSACVAVVVPDNAYDTRRAYGAGWECMHGFRKIDDAACVAVAVPEGGFLDSSGERWRCLRGYMKVDDTCQEIVVPENANLDDSDFGTGWTCDRGYADSDQGCNFIDIPTNAHLDRSGNRWECDRNFQISKGLCVLNN